jgi:CheY-like chemotaxis protein
MPAPFHLLILENSPADAELMLEMVRESGFDPESHHVDTEKDYLVALGRAPDFILSDSSMPGFDARRAIHLMKEPGLDIPFIVVSGCIGKEMAVQCMKAHFCL